MNNLHLFKDHLYENEEYDKDKEWSYNYVVKMLKDGPMYMQKLISTLEKFKGTNKKGDWIDKTKITEKIFNYITNPKW